MAVLTPNLYPSAQMARSLAGKLNAGDQSVQNTIDVAINTAINAGLFTCTASVSSVGNDKLNDAMNLLQQLGYTVSLSSTTLTISW